jgi:hypothetical protein
MSSKSRWLGSAEKTRPVLRKSQWVMFRFLQIAVPILVVADFLVRWRKGLLDWFSVALLIGVALLLIGSFVDGPAGEWLAAAAGIIFLGRSAVAYFLMKRNRKLPSLNDNQVRQ